MIPMMSALSVKPAVVSVLVDCMMVVVNVHVKGVV